MSSSPESRNDDRKPPRKAVALRYAPGDSHAPRVVAKGARETADRIEQLALENGVPLHHDPDLVELLSASEIGDEVPEEVYAAVARVLTFLWGLRDEGGTSLGGKA